MDNREQKHLLTEKEQLLASRIWSCSTSTLEINGKMDSRRWNYTMIKWCKRIWFDVTSCMEYSAKRVDLIITLLDVFKRVQMKEKAREGNDDVAILDLL